MNKCMSDFFRASVTRTLFTGSRQVKKLGHHKWLVRCDCCVKSNFMWNVRSRTVHGRAFQCGWWSDAMWVGHLILLIPHLWTHLYRFSNDDRVTFMHHRASHEARKLLPDEINTGYPFVLTERQFSLEFCFNSLKHVKSKSMKHSTNKQWCTPECKNRIFPMKHPETRTRQTRDTKSI